jgi:hypothetical protein
VAVDFDRVVYSILCRLQILAACLANSEFELSTGAKSRCDTAEIGSVKHKARKWATITTLNPLKANFSDEQIERSQVPSLLE